MQMKMMIKRLISEWVLTSSGASVPRTHESLVRAFAGIDPGKPGQYSLDMLLEEGLVDVTHTGQYVLTKKGCEMRKELGNAYLPQDGQTGTSEVGNPLEWGRFRKMLRYYHECVRRQSAGKDYLYEEDNGYKYIIPNLGYHWLKGVEEECQVHEITLRRRELPAQGYLHAVSGEQKLYIGYPVEAFEYNGKTLYTPVGLIPVEIVGGSKTTMHLQLHHRDASINPFWMDFHIPKQDRRKVYNSILALHAKDEYYGTVDLSLALDWLQRYSRSETVLNQDYVDFFLPKMEKGQTCLCNTPILFAEQNATYTKNLLRELEQIANEPAEVLDRTALAYVFREHPLKWKPREVLDVALPYIKCNDEQRQAVTEALNKPISRVTGPPGTGKSQVAVNIIANLVCRGRSVLFTSRNHKAVHAIAERSLSVDRNLVKFCSTPDGKTTRFWYDFDLELLLADAKVNHHEEDCECYKMIQVAEASHQQIENRFAGRQKANNVLNKWRIAKEAKEALLGQLLPELSSPDGSKIAELEENMRGLVQKPQWGWSIRAILENLKWWRNGKAKYEYCRDWLRRSYPSLFRMDQSGESVKRHVDKFLEEARKYVAIAQVYRTACAEAETQPVVTPKDLEDMDVLLKVFEDKKERALTYSMTDALVKVGCDDVQFAQLKNIMGFFGKRRGIYQEQILDEEQIATAKAGVKNFLTCCPAWAATMLSLTKASPCIAGAFDHVVIDEASQCDIPPMIPALFRAKHATIIGDPQQFPPVRDLAASIHGYIMQRCKITELDDMRFTYLDHSAYDVPLEHPVLLREHYRCHGDIAAFSNEEFYDNQLKICTNETVLKNPGAFGLQRALEWIDVQDSAEGEIQAVEKHLQILKDSKYEGSVGVITPFRSVADNMAQRFYKFQDSLAEFTVNTANGFQGGERDLIIFVLGYNSSLTKGQKWYAEADENRYIYNVAVSRARACALIVGDRERCRKSGIRVLQSLADHPKAVVPPGEHCFDSVWEERLYEALRKARVVVRPQYPVGNRRLDLAYTSSHFMLDIEVDGVRYHAADEYGRKADDIYRDLQLRSLGWAVQRFWVYELEQDMDKCVQIVKERIKKRC